MSKGTPRRSIRVEDDLWDKASAIAAERDDNLSEVVRNGLRAYIIGHSLRSEAYVHTESKESQ